jgi:hypothetical protein
LAFDGHDVFVVAHRWIHGTASEKMCRLFAHREGSGWMDVYVTGLLADETRVYWSTKTSIWARPKPTRAQMLCL